MGQAGVVFSHLPRRIRQMWSFIASCQCCITRSARALFFNVITLRSLRLVLAQRFHTRTERLMPRCCCRATRCFAFCSSTALRHISTPSSPAQGITLCRTCDNSRRPVLNRLWRVSRFFALQLEVCVCVCVERVRYMGRGSETWRKLDHSTAVSRQKPKYVDKTMYVCFSNTLLNF